MTTLDCLPFLALPSLVLVCLWVRAWADDRLERRVEAYRGRTQAVKGHSCRWERAESAVRLWQAERDAEDRRIHALYGLPYVDVRPLEERE